MEGKRTIQFKSTPANYRKESLGLKRNTVRDLAEDSPENDIRRAILDEFISGELDNLFIKIIKTTTLESFERQVTDVTIFAGIGVYIISW